MQSDPLLQVFFEEAAERLADAEGALLQLEQAPGDEQLLNRLFRCAHTLKSNGSLLGFQEIARFTHGLEDLLDLLRKKKRVLTAGVVDALLAAQDVLRALLGHARNRTEPSTSEVRLRDQVMETIQILIQTESPSNTVLSQATVLEKAPEELLALSQKEMEQAPPTTNHKPEPVAVRPADEPDGFRRRSSDLEEASSIRVPIERVDALVNLVGELVISQSIISQAVTGFTPDKLLILQDAVAQMDRQVRELHERLMSVRMVPLKHLFGRLPRLVRDLASATGKEVQLFLSGEETELDKTVIERIADPLTHLIRNAVDHGIESPSQREAKGKSRTGTLELKAYHQGGNVYLELADDGQGIDRERVRQRALQEGLIRAEEPPTEEETLELLFRPGFSTATHITEISGRGVGMDVVRQNLQSLGGSIHLQSSNGSGTRFRIRLPLTVAIMDGQAVRVGDQIFLLPLVVIVESIRPEPNSIHSVAEAGEVVVIRGKAIPLAHLHRLLHIVPVTPHADQGLVVLVEHEEHKLALLVDEVLGQQQVVIKSLERHYDKVPGIAGATILSDGRVSLILDVPELRDLARRASTASNHHLWGVAHDRIC